MYKYLYPAIKRCEKQARAALGEGAARNYLFSTKFVYVN